MTSFLNNYVPRNIDPFYFKANDRVEFRIANNEPNKYIKPNFRLQGIQITPSAETVFPYCIGAWSLIRRITLYNDNQVLNYLYDAQPYMNFKQLLKDNEKQDGLNVPKIMNRWNWGFNKEQRGELKLSDPVNGYNVVSPDPVANNSPLLNINEALDLLNKIEYFDTNVFKRLRLVIEFENRAGRIFLSNETIANMSQPTLLFEEINPELIENKNSKMVIPFINMISEDILVGAIAGNNSNQKVTHRVKAFDNRVVNRILIANQQEDTDGASQTGHWNSVFYPNERFNLEVNGIDLVPYNGVQHPNQKLALCQDAWGKMTLPYNSQGAIPTNVDRTWQSQQTLEGLSRAQLGYLGFPLDRRVYQFNLNYERTSLAGALSNATVNNLDRSAFTMKVFGEVEMILGVDNGKIDVQY